MLKRVSALVLGTVCCTAATLTAQRGAPAPAAGVTLEQIMADPDWIGRSPENAYWGDDNKTIYYSQKREGSPLRDLYAVEVATGAIRKVPDGELAGASAIGGDYNRGRTLHVFVHDDNVFVRDLRARRH